MAGPLPSAHPAKPNRMTVSANAAGDAPDHLPGLLPSAAQQWLLLGSTEPLTVDSEQSQRGHSSLVQPQHFTDQDLRAQREAVDLCPSYTSCWPCSLAPGEHVSELPKAHPAGLQEARPQQGLREGGKEGEQRGFLWFPQLLAKQVKVGD